MGANTTKTAVGHEIDDSGGGELGSGFHAHVVMAAVETLAVVRGEVSSSEVAVSPIIRVMDAACRCGSPTMEPRPRHPLRLEDCSSARCHNPIGKKLVEGHRATSEHASVVATLARRRAFEGGCDGQIEEGVRISQLRGGSAACGECQSGSVA